MTLRHFAIDTRPLVLGHAVAAILLDPEGRYLLQRRDDIPGIWFPGHWGFFGGAIESGEAPVAATLRELAEEIGIALAPSRLATFLRMDFDLEGVGRRERHFFTATLAADELPRLVLGEGAEMRWFAGAEALAALPVTSYDATALFLHHARARIR
jgi:8-oxo-dGTP pyrophosphatase MutT (NUDIX family)